MKISDFQLDTPLILCFSIGGVLRPPPMESVINNHNGGLKMAGKDGRSSNWNFILYPESAPDNWVDIINETRIEWVCSPLHDKDVDPTGEVKKAHYHITLLYPSNKSFEQVVGLVVHDLKQPIPVKCQSVKGSIRYMVHKDNPDKFQYDWNDIKCYGGADLQSLCQPTSSERLALLKEILAFCSDNAISELCDLVDICILNEYNDWLSVICNYNTLVISKHIDSIRYKKFQSE